MASHGSGDQYIPSGYAQNPSTNGATGPGTYSSSIQSGTSALDYANFVNPSDAILNPDRYYEHLNNRVADLQSKAQSYFDSKFWTDENYLAHLSELASKGNVDAQQWLANYFASEQSAKTARDWTAQREDNAYQRLIVDLQKAGISPYILSGATPAVSSSSGRSYSGTELVSTANNKANNKTSEQNAALQSVLRVLGITLAAIIYAL